MLAADSDSLNSLSSLQKLLLGGEALPPVLVEELRQTVGGEILNMYGPTETTIWSTTDRVDNGEGPISIGRPIANTQVYVVDERLRRANVGMEGELLIGGAGVVRGYLNRPDLTAEKFIPNPFSTDSSSRLYRTGDLARMLSDGRIEFIGRIDHQVKIRGFRVELCEIEETLCAHESVSEAVVLAREDQSGERRLFAYVIPANGQVSPASLRSFLQEKLPEQMIPAAFVSLERFPLTPNNKIDRRALLSIDVSQRETSTRYVAPQSDIERRLAEVWRAGLGVERVGLDDNFFDIGGDSMLAVRITVEARQAAGRDLKLVDLFKHPTVRSLAAFLAGEAKDDSAMRESADRAAARRNMKLRRENVRQGERSSQTAQA
jgi:acyl carrier protein